MNFILSVNQEEDNIFKCVTCMAWLVSCGSCTKWFKRYISRMLMGPDAMTLVFWMLSFKSTFSLSSLTLDKIEMKNKSPYSSLFIKIKKSSHVVASRWDWTGLPSQKVYELLSSEFSSPDLFYIKLLHLLTSLCLSLFEPYIAESLCQKKHSLL